MNGALNDVYETQYLADQNKIPAKRYGQERVCGLKLRSWANRN